MMTSKIWEHHGEAGPHIGHRLVANESYEVWCIDCEKTPGDKVFLSNHEANIAWPTVVSCREYRAIEASTNEYGIRIQYERRGSHTHAMIYVGRIGTTYGQSGLLIMTNEEFKAWKEGTMLHQWSELTRAKQSV